MLNSYDRVRAHAEIAEVGFEEWRAPPPLQRDIEDWRRFPAAEDSALERSVEAEQPDEQVAVAVAVEVAASQRGEVRLAVQTPMLRGGGGAERGASGTEPAGASCCRAAA